MKHVLIVDLDPDMSQKTVEKLERAILAARGVMRVKWQEVVPCPECSTKIVSAVLGEENVLCPDCAGHGYVDPTRGEPDGATCVSCGGSGKNR